MAKQEKQGLKESSEDKIATSQKKIGGEVPIVINEIVDDCLYASLFGTLDPARIKSAVDLLLAIASTSETNVIIIDLSNVNMMDPAITEKLAKVTRALQTEGMKVIYCGIRLMVS